MRSSASTKMRQSLTTTTATDLKRRRWGLGIVWYTSLMILLGHPGIVGGFCSNVVVLSSPSSKSSSVRCSVQKSHREQKIRSNRDAKIPDIDDWDGIAAGEQPSFPSSRRKFVAWGSAIGAATYGLPSLSAIAGGVAPETGTKRGENSSVSKNQVQVAVTDMVETQVIPFSTNRRYKSIRLPNGMEVLLVSDKVVTQATAALTIRGAGQFSDPAGLNGLAHLMEHMTLSSRSSKRRFNRNSVNNQNNNEDFQDFEEWLAEFDGSSNGFTAYEKVCFHFNCPSEALPDALGRFGKLFQQGSIEQVCRNEDTLKREIRRVDSELIKSDAFLRELYLTKGIINPQHPYARFSAGSLESLETLPRQQNITVGDELVRFFNDHYQPSRAVLVVVSRNELSSMETWVAPFATALSKKGDQNSASIGLERVFPEFFLRQSKLAALCLYRGSTGNAPGEELEKLSFQWGLNLNYTGLGEEGRNVVTATQIGFVLSQILGRRGPGGLYNLCKKRNWVPDGSQGVPRISFPVDVTGFQILRLEISLTRQGFSSRSAVIAAVYDSINSLEGSPLGPFVLSREQIADYAAVAQLYGYTLAPRPPDAIELAMDAQVYGINGPNGVANPQWRLFPLPEDRAGIAAIQRTLQKTLIVMSNPGSAIIISTASKKAIQFAEKNLLENSFPPLSPASWNISPVTGARYYFDNMFRLSGLLNEWLVARLMEDELSPPVINPLVPTRIRAPRLPSSTRTTSEMVNQDSISSVTHSTGRRGMMQKVRPNFAASEVKDTAPTDYVDDPMQTSIVRDYWKVLRVSSHGTILSRLQLPRIAPEPSSRCVFVLQLLSSRPARANTEMAARAELWKMSFEYSISDLAELGVSGGLAYEISFNKYGMRICFLGLSQNIASYARRLSRKMVEHQTRLLEGPDKLPSIVQEAAIRSANRAPNVSAQRKGQILGLLRESSAADAAVEGVAFFKSCSGGVCFTQGDLLPKEASAILGDLKLIFRTVIGSNVRPSPAVPEVEDLIYRTNWIPRSASSCTIPGASLVSNACGRIPR